MGNWVEIVDQHRKRLGIEIWDDIPESSFSELATQCGPDELTEIKQRLIELDKEESEIPEWDGDSIVRLRKARFLFESILEMKSSV